MKYEKLGQCRGDNKIYVKLRLTHCKNTAVQVSSWDARKTTHLPASFKVLETGNDWLIGVLVLFDVAIGQVVELSVDADTPLRLFFSRAVSALASKVNGLIRKDFCREIRNIDSQGLTSDIFITCESAVPLNENKVLLKGRFSTPSNIQASVSVIDRKGKIVSSDFTVMGRTEEDESLRSELAWWHYAIKIPHLGDTVCFVLRDDDGNQIGSCYVLEKYRLKQLKQALENRFESAFFQRDYENWLFAHRLTEAQAEYERGRSFEYEPLFSIIVPLYKTPASFFKDMANSVLQQTYRNWELILVNSTPDIVELKRLVDSYAERDPRIKVIELDRNLGITENTNKGIEAAKGDFLCFFDHDDTLEPDILFEYTSALNADHEINLLYCDEDKILLNGRFGDPTFKPDFSLDMIRDNNYICHLLTVRKSVYDTIEPSSAELDGAQDHAMVLKIIERGGHVHHVPRILYHWRMSETSTASNSDTKPYATEAGIKAVQQHLDRVGARGTVECSHGRAFRYLVRYATPGDPLVSVIVATRGDMLVLERFVEMLGGASYPHIELIIVASTGFADDDEILGMSERYGLAARLVIDDRPFFYSSRLNRGAAEAQGSVLVFCHDDIESQDPDWITVLAGHALRPEVGLVGTMTVSEDSTVQQAGVAIVDGELVKLSVGIQYETPGYIFYPLTTRNTSVVDDACIAIRHDAFTELGGFDERYGRYFAVADLSLAAASKGYLNVYTPEASVWHFSPAAAFGPSKPKDRQYFIDKASFLARWSDMLARDDPYFNPNFSRSLADAAQYRFDAVSGMPASSL